MDDKLYNEIQQLIRKGMEAKDIAYELEIPLKIVYSLMRKKGQNAESKNKQSDN